MAHRTILCLTLAATFALDTSSQGQAPRTIPLDAVTIAEVNSAFDAGWLTSEQLVQMFLARIEAYDRRSPCMAFRWC